MLRGPKIISCPVYGLIDIADVLPLVETKWFQALRYKIQLGLTSVVFPSATHTRFAHCVGAYHATKKLADRWRKLGLINDAEEKALPVYALLHDIGHPAFSHTVEDFCRVDDDVRTLELIRGPLRPIIEKLDVDFRLVESLADHTNPLYLAVHDKNLGMEKLDYLQRDGQVTILSEPPGINFLREHIYYVNGKLAIDQKVAGYAIDVMNFYMKMYKEVYFRKASVIAQRMFHKMVYHLILAKELNPEDLMDMTDHELIGLACASRDPTVRLLYQHYRERRLFREAVVIRPEKFVEETRIAEKPIFVHGVSEDMMSQLILAKPLQTGAHGQLENIEYELACYLQIPDSAVLVVPVFGPQRFVATDVNVYGENGQLHSLREMKPAHFLGMEEMAHSYMALRICVQEEHRELVSSQAIAGSLGDQLFSLIY